MCRKIELESARGIAVGFEDAKGTKLAEIMVKFDMPAT
jgi:hypothetical protein